jgi:photosystem II stability/assembly factor-like uncharacterized protein
MKLIAALSTRSGRLLSVLALSLSLALLVVTVIRAGNNTWTASNTGLTNQAIFSMAIDSTNVLSMYVGTNGGGVFKSSDAGSTWAARNTGLTNLVITALEIDPTNVLTMYAGTGTGSIFKSSNAASNWPDSSIGLPGMAGGQVADIAIDPTNVLTLYAGILNFAIPGNGGVFKSVDGGANWTTSSTGITNTIITSLALEPTSPTTLYASTFSGSVFKTINGGTTWTNGSNGLPGTAITKVLLDPTIPTTLYAGTNGNGVFKSTDGGSTWLNSSIGLTATNITTLALDPTNTNTLYAGTAGVVFKSANGGGTWTNSGPGLPGDLVSTLAARGDTAYAGTINQTFTNGSGVYAITFAPEIAVSQGGTNIPDGGNFNFGTTSVGQFVIKTFTISNTGTATLTLSGLTVPNDFTIDNNFVTTTVAPNASTTFAVRLNAATAGTFAGTLQFTNNDTDENPYNFTVNGTVISGSTIFLPLVLKAPTTTGPTPGAWTAQTSGSTTTLNDVSCPSTTTCIAVGNGGTILATTNGGTTWSSKVSGTTNTLNGVICPSATQCVAVGESGTIVKTTDGGNTWSSKPSPTANSLRGVSCTILIVSGP